MLAFYCHSNLDFRTKPGHGIDQSQGPTIRLVPLICVGTLSVHEYKVEVKGKFL